MTIAPADSKPDSPSPPPDGTPSGEGPPGSEGRQDLPATSQPPPGQQGGAGTETAGTHAMATGEASDKGEAAPPAGSMQSRSPPQGIRMGLGLATDSAYSSSTTKGSQFSYDALPKQPRISPGGRSRHEEVQYFKDTLPEMEYWEEFFNPVDQRGSPDHSFFVAQGVPPDPSSRAYMAYLADHPARLHTAVGLRDRLVHWMMQEQGQQLWPPGRAHPNMGPAAPLSGDIL